VEPSSGLDMVELKNLSHQESCAIYLKAYSLYPLSIRKVT